LDYLEQLSSIQEIPLTQEEIYKHLCYICDVLKAKTIKHWIVYGTLLGSVREKGIIKYDYDFDIGIFYEDYEKILNLNEIINEDGYMLQKGFGVVYNPLNKKESEYKWRVSLKLNYKERPVGDLYIYKIFEDGFVRRYDEAEKIYYYPNSTFPYLFVEELTTTRINDRFFPAPRRPEVLLEYFYGPMWRVPIKALSQGGSGHSDYDYYGNYKYSQLNTLIEYVKNALGIIVTPEIKAEIINFIFPLDQIEWLSANEKITFKKSKRISDINNQ